MKAFSPWPRWALPALSLEMRKLLSYRFDFWAAFAGLIAAEMATAYFLWKAVFDYRHVSSLGGYTFHGMMLYYLLVPLVGRVTRGEEMKFISDEIYEGSLTRYLLYPLSYFGYKYVQQLAVSIIALVQLLALLGIFGAAFGFPAEARVTALSVLEGVAACYAANLLYISLAAGIEMVAFWADSVWSLMVMLKFILVMAGGALVPLSLFPEAIRHALEFSPFPYLVSFPIRSLMAALMPGEWVRGIAMTLLWALAFRGVAELVWKRGTKQYSGVGI